MTGRWFILLALLVPPLAVTLLALPRLMSGMTLEAAFPASLAITANVPQSPPSYMRAAELLSEAPIGDGETQILRAEAAMDAGQPPASLIPVVKTALSRSPCSARGWILLAALLRDRDPKAAGADLSLAFPLAPFDYYLILPRTLVGASLWENLPRQVRTTLLGDVRRLAMDKSRRPDLRALLSRPGGAELVARSLADRPDDLRQLNQDVARESLHL